MKQVNFKRKGEIVMKKDDSKQAVKKEKQSALKTPKTFRRIDRMIKNHGLNLNNDGSKKNSNARIIGFSFWNSQAIYIPRRGKLKGWQKNNRKYKSVS